MTVLRLFAIVLCLACGFAKPAEASVRIKDIAALQGVCDNQIVGYGLVIGLKGTGDSLRNSPFTEQSLQSMLDSMGINVRDSSLRTRNVAGVIVTAELPPFIGKGARIDITVSSLGDATSLLGGTLVMTRYKRLIDDICPSQISYSGLQAVLKLLLSERVSIRSLHLILEAVAEIAPHARRSEQVVEHVRMRIAQQICGDLTVRCS